MVNYDSLNSTFAALSDPTRRAILSRLAGEDTALTEIARPFDMSLPAIMKHVAVLEGAGLLSREKSGRVVTCRLNAQPLREAAQWLIFYEQFWQERLDNLAAYLEFDKESKKWKRKLRSGSHAASTPRAKKSSRRGPTRRR